jgi:hypothetical protein
MPLSVVSPFSMPSNALSCFFLATSQSYAGAADIAHINAKNHGMHEHHTKVLFVQPGGAQLACSNCRVASVCV